jgi:hypothetical protein
MFNSLYFMAVVLLPALQNPGAAPAQAQPEASGVQKTGAASGLGSPAHASDPVREALRDGQYPWYDAGADRGRPVWPARTSWLEWVRQKLRSIGKAIDRIFFPAGGAGSPVRVRGDWLGTILLSTVLATFFMFLVMLWVRREPFGVATNASRARPGTSELLAQLPEDLKPGLDDPWAEAQRRRLAGDFAGAVIHLFAHQLISLHRVGLIRLLPGWTGRQYVRWLRDPVLVDSLGATLLLFEEIYYGHRLPSAEAFEQVWSRAQALEDRRDKLEVSS